MVQSNGKFVTGDMKLKNPNCNGHGKYGEIAMCRWLRLSYRIIPRVSAVTDVTTKRVVSLPWRGLFQSRQLATRIIVSAVSGYQSTICYTPWDYRRLFVTRQFFAVSSHIELLSPFHKNLILFNASTSKLPWIIFAHTIQHKCDIWGQRQLRKFSFLRETVLQSNASQQPFLGKIFEF